MNKLRLEALSDAVFGIVLTLLVIEIRVPEFVEKLSGAKLDSSLLHSLEELLPLFFAYFLSFMIIASYWFTHNFLFSLLAQNLNRKLINLNFIFLAFLSLIPFSSHLLGRYPESKIAVFVYALNIALVGLITAFSRNYIFDEPTIKNPEFSQINITKQDMVHGSVRVLIGFFGALAAVALSFVDTRASIVLLILQAVILIVPGLVQMFGNITGLNKNMVLHNRWAFLEEGNGTTKSDTKSRK
jgi:uncharacterized membrane protein